MQEIIVYDIDNNILDTLVQWDRDVKMFVTDDNIDKAYNVHFFNKNSDTAMVVPSSYEDGVLSAQIPNDILTESYPIIGYIFIEKNNEHKSVYCFRIIVRKRPKPCNYVYSDEKEFFTFEKILQEAKNYALLASNSATLAKNSEDASKISETNAKYSENNAKLSEEASKTSEDNAKLSETNAKDSENASKDSETNAKTSEENAKASELIATQKADDASTSADNASTSEINSKASEVASKASEEAALSSEQASKLSEQNATDSANTATQKADDASTSADNAENYSLISKSYAEGTDGTVRPNDVTDNAKSYSQLAQHLTEEASKLLEQAQKIVAAATTGSLIPAGTIAFSALPAEPNIGYMYNISDDFTTDDRFVEGAGVFYRAGANIYWTANELWDVLTGVQVTGVKGDSEADYRVGNVNITKANIGLENVENTSDAEKNVATAKTITDILPVSKGGTGAETENDAAHVFLSGLIIDNDFIIDDTDNFIYDFGGGGLFGRSPITSLWNWIKDKINDAGEFINNVKRASTLKDSNDGNNITASFSKETLNSASYLTAWNGYELRAISRASVVTPAGSTTQPIFINSSGIPAPCAYTLNKSVPSNAVFTDTNTWRGIQDNLTSDSATDSLSAKQGKVLSERQTDIVKYQVFSIDNQTLSASNYKAFTIPYTVPSGYKVLSLVGVDLTNASSSGVNSTFCVCYHETWDYSAKTITVGIRNTSSNNAKIEIKARMLFIRDI